MIPPSKLMCQLAYIHRGLDKEQEEYKKKSRYDLALKLRKVVDGVAELEKKEYDSSFRVILNRDSAISILEAIDQGAPIEDLRVYALEIIDTCSFDDNEKTPVAANN